MIKKLLYPFVLLVTLCAISSRIHAQGFGEEGDPGGDLPPVVVTPPPPPPPPPPDPEPTPPDPCTINPASCQTTDPCQTNPCACGASCGGGTGTTPPTTPPPAQPKYIKANLPTHMTVQSSQLTCVPAIFAYLNQLFGGNLTEASFIALFATQFPTQPDITDNGIKTGATLVAFINDNFNTSPYNGVTAAINAGDPILTQISEGYDPTTGTPLYHEVLIVGYDAADNSANQKIYYMDPGTGNIQSMTLLQFNNQNPAPTAPPLVITGKK